MKAGWRILKFNSRNLLRNTNTNNTIIQQYLYSISSPNYNILLFFFGNFEILAHILQIFINYHIYRLEIEIGQES
jgi:hypothetical protein